MKKIIIALLTVCTTQINADGFTFGFSPEVTAILNQGIKIDPQSLAGVRGMVDRITSSPIKTENTFGLSQKTNDVAEKLTTAIQALANPRLHTDASTLEALLRIKEIVGAVPNRHTAVIELEPETRKTINGLLAAIEKLQPDSNGNIALPTNITINHDLGINATLQQSGYVALGIGLGALSLYIFNAIAQKHINSEEDKKSISLPALSIGGVTGAAGFALIYFSGLLAGIK